MLYPPDSSKLPEKARIPYWQMAIQNAECAKQLLTLQVKFSKFNKATVERNGKRA